jgi:hypothetical protein
MQGDTATLAAALQHGAAIDSLDTRRNPNGRRALNWAAWYNQPVALRFLVARGATVNVANRTGFTPLHHAAENGSRDRRPAQVSSVSASKTSWVVVLRSPDDERFSGQPSAASGCRARQPSRACQAAAGPNPMGLPDWAGCILGVRNVSLMLA